MNDKTMSGSGWGGMSIAETVEDISQVSVGVLLLNYSEQFHTQNVIKISRIGNDATDRVCYGVFVDPNNLTQLRNDCDAEFAIWDHDFQRGEYHFPHITLGDDEELSPCDVCHSDPAFQTCDKNCFYKPA